MRLAITSILTALMLSSHLLALSDEPLPIPSQIWSAMPRDKIAAKQHFIDKLPIVGSDKTAKGTMLIMLYQLHLKFNLECEELCEDIKHNSIASRLFGTVILSENREEGFFNAFISAGYKATQTREIMATCNEINYMDEYL